MNTYSNEDIEGFHAKDMRISWLSIFSSLTKALDIDKVKVETLAETAYELNENLYKKYPFVIKQIPTGEPSKSTSYVPKSIVGANRVVTGGSNKLCPVCQSPMNRVFNKKNEKAPDWKCTKPGCKFQWKNGQWVKSDYITGAWDEKPEDIARANFNDQMTDEANNLPIVEDGY